MARFNLDDYETVEQRIARFYADNPAGRIITEYITTESDRARGQWIVRASVYTDAADDQPKATGLAFEVDGQGMANQTSALENAETSSIGRALANAGYSGNKRASREEMQKVQRGVTPMPAPKAGAAVPDGFIDAIADISSIDELRSAWVSAGDGGYLTEAVIEAIDRRRKVLEAKK